MEALLLIFAELLFALLAPVLTAVGAFFLLLFELLAVLIYSLFGGSGAKRRKASATTSKPTELQRTRPVVSRKFILWSGGILGGLAVCLVIASAVFFDPLLRSVLDAAGDKAGVEISYSQSSGSLLAGKVALDDVTLTRNSVDGLAFDIAVDRLEADVALLSLLSNEPRIEQAAVAGVRGFVTPPVPKEAEDRPERLTKRRAFRADLAAVTDVDIEIRPRGSEPYDIVIETAHVVPLRSRLAVFDLLFRSNLVAEMAGQPLFVSTREISEQGRETIWRFEEVEVESLKLILPKAPLTWLSDGTVTARVEDRWDLTDDEIDMDWQITLNEVGVAPPEAAGNMERFLVAGLAKAVERQGGSADFRYQLELGPEQVAELRSGDLRAFWDVVLAGFTKPEIEPISGEDAEEDGGGIRGAIDALRDRMRRDGE